MSGHNLVTKDAIASGLAIIFRHSQLTEQYMVKHQLISKTSDSKSGLEMVYLISPTLYMYTLLAHQKSSFSRIFS